MMPDQQRAGSMLDFHVAVFAANEGDAIARCVAAIDRAAGNSATHISVLLNGTTDASEARLRAVPLLHAGMSVYRIARADKSNAINVFLRQLHGEAKLYVAVDGYAEIGDGALRALRDAAEQHPQAHIASGVPTAGRSAAATAAATLAGGVVNGQLYAMSAGFVRRFAELGVRLPVQLYRGDGLLGSIAAHDFRPTETTWDSQRVIGVAAATFRFRPLSWWRWRDVRRQYARWVRQARGRIENAAIQEIIYRDGYQALPENANAMIETWLASHRPEPRSPAEAYFTRRAIEALRRAPRLGAMPAEPLFARRPGEA